MAKSKEELAEYKHNWYLKNIEKRKFQERERYKKKRKHILLKVNEYRRNRFKTDIPFKLLYNLRHRCQQAITKGYKSASTIELLGASIDVVKQHLESLFKEEMTWDNYGFGKRNWHIDHIRPCASFDLTDPVQQKQCFNYKNLQPLWQEENLSKNDTWIPTRAQPPHS